MNKTTAGLLGAVAGLATMGAAHAATSAVPNPADALQASSYADLLAPVENATLLMRADDAARTRQTGTNADEVQLAQYYERYHHHHHHHHHHAYYRHHHHHHHHHNTFVGIPGVGGVVVSNH